jgi:hypothetical protein
MPKLSIEEHLDNLEQKILHANGVFDRLYTLETERPILLQRIADIENWYSHFAGLAKRQEILEDQARGLVNHLAGFEKRFGAVETQLAHILQSPGDRLETLERLTNMEKRFHIFEHRLNHRGITGVCPECLEYSLGFEFLRAPGEEPKPRKEPPADPKFVCPECHTAVLDRKQIKDLTEFIVRHSRICPLTQDNPY